MPLDRYGRTADVDLKKFSREDATQRKSAAANAPLSEKTKKSLSKEPGGFERPEAEERTSFAKTELRSSAPLEPLLDVVSDLSPFPGNIPKRIRPPFALPGSYYELFAKLSCEKALTA
jgi:hypothetical protein